MKIRKIPEKKSKANIETILKLSVSASLASLGIILSAIVVYIPNIEFISVTIFLIALLFGHYYGIITAVAITIVYEFFVTSIYGSAGLLIFFKLFCYVCLALIAGLGRKSFLKLSFWELGIFGSLFALIYDIVTTLGAQLIILQSEITPYYIFLVLITGIPFTIIHFLGNFALFSLTRNAIKWIISAFKHRGIKLLMIPAFMEIKKESTSQQKVIQHE
ncbi:MAG: hypothetical protein ACFFDS_00135 [Candidatus Thorarchaeota archaeon]